MQSSGREPRDSRPVAASVDKENELTEGLSTQGDAQVKLDESAQAMIGQRLKAVYSAIVREPVPDQFLKLLEELERKEKDR